ncbi:Breast cancer suppressor protein BRCT [Ophiocordyceps camponoti-floridani]|uniref:Breast cancer suppressor protein BRCT n=1 Tax=Ophiocordyceps camponoti-floridani TaxID=2030778 RepID=A0A8H4Q7X9_9HYPO|nr:Breast cancer suppressor protein BRCT [Ophiocordyceps camponoti-floridani]
MDPVHSLANAATASAPVPTPPRDEGRTPMEVSVAMQAQPPHDLLSASSPALSPAPLSRPEETPGRLPLFSPASSIGHIGPRTSPPPRKDTISSISTQATTATLASTETSNTSYSADTSPSLQQSIPSVQDGPDVSNSRRTSRRRTGPLSQQSRERAALIRKLGACADCRRRRVACHPSHHNLTWEDLVNKFHRSHSPGIQDIAPSLASGRPLSPAGQPTFMHDPHEMDVDSDTHTHHQPARQALNDARVRTPLPSGPRLEKSLSLPGIESLKNELQSNIPRTLSTSNRGRYNAVQALLLYWQDDDDLPIVEAAVKELADVVDKYYHYTFHIQTIPSSSDACKSSWRWLSRQLSEFAEEHDQRDVLKIVYYAGHTHLDGNREMVLASSRDGGKASVIRWNGIQQILEEACSDTLILMDAAYYPSSTMVRQKGVLELIAASVSEEHVAALDRCAFTRALAEQLRTRATRSNPLSAVELHSILLAAYPKLIHDRAPERETVTSFPAPLHAMMSGNSRLPSIFLSPVYQNSPLRSSFSCENSPQLHLSIKLHDDNVDIESWNEWLRLMPEGVKDVKVDGPFRASFR